MSLAILDEIPSYYQNYVRQVKDENLIPAMINEGNVTLDLLKKINEAAGDYAYEEGKWTIKQVVAHIIDTERVFAYRALSFARNDSSQLPGFEQNDWALQTNVEQRQLYKVINEFANLRASTVDLFGSFSDQHLNRKGTASGNTFSVKALGYIIVGHEIHHRRILQQHYLK